MRLEQLKYFLKAVETGSFTKAANQLYVQQPTLRQGINNLEKELGHKLFIRTRQGVAVTDYGKEILPDVKQAVNILEKVKNKDNVFLSTDKVEVWTEMDYLFSLMYDPYIFDSIYTEKFNKTVKVKASINNDTKLILHNIIAGKTDIGLISYLDRDYQNIMIYPQLSHFELHRMSIGVKMRKDHPLAKKKTIKVKDLKDYMVIFTGSPTPVLLNQVQQHVKELDYIVSNNMKLIYKYCMQENGIFINTENRSNSFNDGLIFKKFYEDYNTIYAAVTDEQESRDEIYQYISLMKSMLGQGHTTGIYL